MIKNRSKAFEDIKKDAIYRELYQNSSEMYRTVNRDGVIILCNKAYAEKLGYTVDEAVGATIFDHIAPKSMSDMKKSYETWLARGKLRDVQLWLKRKDGSELPVLLSANNLYDTEGNLIGSNTVIRDISDLVDAQNLIKNLQVKRLTDIGELAARISHDMRNPLSVIKISLEVLSATKDPFLKKHNEQFQRINRAVMRLSHQLEEVLDHIKPRPLNAQAWSLLGIITSVVEKLEKHNSLKIILPQTDSVIECDDEKLEIVFANLILNAIQAMGNKGIVTIRILDEKKSARIEIEDTGPGIPENLRLMIFEPLFTTRQIGTGLGLPSCKTIVEKHHGQISFSSEIGKGTKFTIILPKTQPK